MSIGMWLGFYILPTIFTIAAMLWYAYSFGPKQDKAMEERRQRLIRERKKREGAEN